MRLDHFLPFVVKPRDGKSPPRRSGFYRFLRAALPTSWTSTPEQRHHGLLRRFLRRVGLSWQSSPLRRLIQSACLLLFLFLFFYVCWPYRAIPAQSYAGWIPIEVDVATGAVQLANENGVPNSITVADHFYILDNSTGAEKPASLGRFEITGRQADGLEIQPATPLTAEELESMSFSIGPWTLAPHGPDEWPSHYADTFAEEDKMSAEIFLILDPLVSLSTAVANRSWVWSLTAAGVILAICVLIPRGFCGYLCPLGTLIDLFDWAVGKRIKRFRVPDNGWWVHLKYYILTGTLVAALAGVLLSGFFAAIPVVTRGMLFTLAPLQDGMIRGWYQVPPMNLGQWLSIALFLTVLGLGLLKPRFWCKYVCPSGAVFSLGNLFRVSERKVESSCIHCNQCVTVCPFDAIKADFTTRTADCTLCQTCGGVCPTHAIKFVSRWDITKLKPTNTPPTGETQMGRRGFLASSIGLTGSALFGTAVAMSVKSGNPLRASESLPVRPPGSVPEQDFLELCIRCGECFKVCPNNVLQPEGFQQGWEGLWTPEVVADWAGCEPSCNACGQVCPTGAIRPLDLGEKRHARMGLARLNHETCLPLAGEEACQLCVDECTAAGYDAIEFIRVHTQVDPQGHPIPGSGFLAPQVRADACVGCGLCQTRCFSVNVKDKHLLEASAIVIKTGPEWEDRLVSGSYRQLAQERLQSRDLQQSTNQEAPSYLPDFLNGDSSEK